MSASAAGFADGTGAATIAGDADARVNVAFSASLTAPIVTIAANLTHDLLANADVAANADGFAAVGSAISRVDVGSASDPSEAEVNISTRATIVSEDSVSITALTQTPSENLVSRAKSNVFGTVASTANSFAFGTMNVNSTVRSSAGSGISTPDLFVQAQTTESLSREPIADADTLVGQFVEQTREVTREITKWLPWPLDALVELVVDVITEIVQVFDFSDTNAAQGGSGLVTTDLIDLNGDIANLGAADRSLTINSDGTVTPGSNVGVTLVGSDEVVVDDIVAVAIELRRQRFFRQRKAHGRDARGRAALRLVGNQTVERAGLMQEIIEGVALQGVQSGFAEVRQSRIGTAGVVGERRFPLQWEGQQCPVHCIALTVIRRCSTL
jgi:hypothetical protein